MIEIVPFVKEHALSFADAIRQLKILTPPEHGALLEKDSIAFTAMKDGKIIGASGIHPLHEGVGHAWSLLHPEIKKEKFFLHKAVKNHLNTFLDLGYFHRVEMLVRTDYPEAISWANHLGFSVEGILRKYGVDKQDYFMYSIVR